MGGVTVQNRIDPHNDVFVTEHRSGPGTFERNHDYTFGT